MKLNPMGSPFFSADFLDQRRHFSRPRHPGDSQLATPQGSESRRGGLWGFLLGEIEAMVTYPRNIDVSVFIVIKSDFDSD